MVRIWAKIIENPDFNKEVNTMLVLNYIHGVGTQDVRQNSPLMGLFTGFLLFVGSTMSLVWNWSVQQIPLY